MDADGFRRIVLGLKDAIESAHMGHPDFRVNGRIFATIHQDNRTGMVKLTPEQQEKLMKENPATFTPENGAWGRAGCTQIRLHAVDEETVGGALTLAYQNALSSPAKRKAGAGKQKTKTRKATKKV
jgi:YjbR